MVRTRSLPSAFAKTERVALSLEQDILSGKLGYGAQLESENALVRRFDVSRNTVRKGLEALADKGLITTRVGIGSFVTFNGRTINDALGWTRALSHEKEAVGVRLLRLARVNEPLLAAELKLPGDDFIAIDRVRELSHAGRVVSIERSRVPYRGELASIVSGGLVDGSLSATLLAVGLRAESGEEWAEVECLGEADAKLAGTAKGTPFLRTRRLVRGAGGEVIEYVVSLLDPRHFALHLAF
jgi:GntR family transcriptional regulator